MVRIPLDKNNRMLRLGIGKHEGRWFLRADLWWSGFRVENEEVFLTLWAVATVSWIIFGPWPT